MGKTEKQKTEKDALKEKCRILTPKFRVSYPHVFKAQAVKGGVPKYSVTMLFDKDEDLGTLKAAIRAAKVVAFGPNKSNWPEDLESPVGDGDSQKNAGKEGYANHWVIKASSGEDSKPGVVDQNVKPILDASKFYPGCFARAYVYAYVWDNEFGKGVGFILDHVQKLDDGDSFGGKKPVDQVFDAVGGGDDDDDATDDDEEEMDFK